MSQADSPARDLASSGLEVGAPPGVWRRLAFGLMDAAAGEPVRVSLPTDAIDALSLGPGDRDLVFSAGNPKPTFWVLRGAGITASHNTAGD